MSYTERLNKLKESLQSLFRSSNIYPSETLKQEGRVFGFSNVTDAINWGKKNGYKHVYQFNSTDWDMDTKTYGSKGRSGEPEFICYNIIKEKKLK